ncbi:MAG: sigma 54-interacting transcriptional regulator [Bilophila wadsworthia]
MYGETGTGKELVAHSLHAASSRSQQPFVVVNCAALPDPLLESELFGYEEGAFTGAKRGGKQGLFELANGGTLFLDEIGDISHAVQLRLLRVLDAREVMHVGGDRFIPINVRVLCASNKQLLHLVRKGTFRMDLYFRLTGVCLEVPPLRNRLEDIALFAAPLLRRYGKDKKALGPEIQKRLKAYNWPGNVRELMAVLESYLVLLGDQATSLACFEEVFRHRDVLPLTPPPLPAATMPDAGDDHNLGRQTTDFRRRKVMEELALNLGDRRKTAAALGISYSSLRRILENMKED